jgi:hypothetical protein
MTLDLYGHLYTDRLDEISGRMDAARESSRAQRTSSTKNSADHLRTNGSSFELNEDGAMDIRQ